MSLLSKPFGAITIADLEHLVSSEARETGELEFKGELPFRPDKGSPSISDRWIEKGDRVGDLARDQLLAEMIAFANADGGTLILGLHETKDEPRRAERLAPLPNCEGLARRLQDAAEDIIEPRLTLLSRGIAAASDGSGFVVLRVSKSLYGPHRLTTTREFYIRRGERAARMTVREIQDVTLNLARTGDRVESIFQERHDAARAQFLSLAHGGSPLLLRVTAIPTTPQRIADLTLRNDLWWIGSQRPMKLGSDPFDYQYPAREFGYVPRIRLRGFEVLQTSGRGLERLLRDDGLIEFRLVHTPDMAQKSERDGKATLYLSWIVGLLVGTLAQIEHLRSQLARDGLEYGLEAEIWSSNPLSLMIQEHNGLLLQNGSPSVPLRLSRYSVRSGPDNLNSVASEFVRDLFNVGGSFWRSECVIEWN